MGGAIQLHLESGLKEDGWFESFYKKQAVDKRGEPIPWLTYPFIRFIEPRLNPDMKVFEFGSGNSTIWFAKRVKEIKSVESNLEWIKLVQPRLNERAQIIHQAYEENQSSAISKYAQAISTNEGQYHIIIVDGKDRNNCVISSLDFLREDGVLILDNSERAEYAEGRKYLHARGFRGLDFWGMTPIVSQNYCTSLFYRSGNCLYI